MDQLQLQQEVKELKITNDAELENANKLAGKVKDLADEVEAKYKDEIAKYNKLHKDALAKKKAELKPLEDAKKIIKKAIGEYMKIVEQRQLEEQKQQQEEQNLFGEVVSAKKEEPNIGGTHVRKTWKARVIDEDKVPIKYGKMVIRQIDQKKLNEIAKYEEGKAEIPGVEFYQDETVVIR